MEGVVVEKVFRVEESRASGLGDGGGWWDSSLRLKTQEEDHLGGAGRLKSLCSCDVQAETPGGS